MINLNVGCGDDIKPQKNGWLNIDYIDKGGVDLVIDFNNERLIDYFNKNSVNIIYASHFLEHIYYPERFIFDCLKIIKRNGEIIVILPTSKNTSVFHKKSGFTKDYFTSIENKHTGNESDKFVYIEKKYRKRYKFNHWALRRYVSLRDYFNRIRYDEIELKIKKYK